jgi:hypothetical protein
LAVLFVRAFTREGWSWRDAALAAIRDDEPVRRE